MRAERIETAMYELGKADALELQNAASKLSGTELNDERDIIPDFSAAKAVMNMLERPIGFVCKSTAGRVVQLLQPYDSGIFTGEPEELAAQWGFKWSIDPEHALPFVALSTSPYMKGDCCLDEAGKARRSAIDGNVWSPEEKAEYWEDVL